MNQKMRKEKLGMHKSAQIQRSTELPSDALHAFLHTSRRPSSIKQGKRFSVQGHDASIVM